MHLLLKYKHQFAFSPDVRSLVVVAMLCCFVLLILLIQLEEFMVYAGILKPDRGQRRGIHDRLIDYRELLDKLCLF